MDTIWEYIIAAVVLVAGVLLLVLPEKYMGKNVTKGLSLFYRILGAVMAIAGAAAMVIYIFF